MRRNAAIAWAAPYDWDAHRPIITRLYIDQDRTLKDVMGIMQRDHNFFGTTKMYKSRIKRWGLAKKLTAHDVPEMLQRIKKDQPRASAAFLIRGRQVPLSRVDQYFRRNTHIALHVNHIAASVSEKPLASAFTFPRLLSLHSNMNLPDEVMRLSRHFIAGSCDGGTWCPDGTNPVFSACPEASTWMNETLCAVMLFQQGRFEPAFASLDVSFEQLRRLLRAPDPTLFIYVYIILLRLPETIRQHMCVYAAEMSAILLSDSHPITLIWLSLSRADTQEVLDHARAILRSFFDLLEQSFGHGGQGFLNFTRIFYNLMSHYKFVDIETAISKYRDVIRGLEALGGCVDDVLLTRLVLSQNLVAIGEYETADAILEQIGREIHSNSGDVSVTVQADYYHRSFEAKKARGITAGAVDSGRELILSCMKFNGPVHVRTLAVVGYVQLYLETIGELGEARRLREVVESRLELGEYFQEVGMTETDAVFDITN